ncbi:MAG: molybdenum cofactor guanylyltransferase MobA [Rubrivivax sp.]|nr:molybdenum cofactor guanylyltransferase MobA [Rubrivivax sp.]
MTALTREQITGLVLAGGRGSRMGGVDKGLQLHGGQPLAQHALQRLAPQVGTLMINANRHLEAYAAMGVPVYADTLADYPGPLAGLAAGMAHCQTPWLVSVPCDSPNFPHDLVARLADALVQQQAQIAMAACFEDGALRTQPVFCLLDCQLLPSLHDFLRSGQRKVDRWTAQHRCVRVDFDDAAAFANANTLAELQQLQSSAAPKA